MPEFDIDAALLTGFTAAPRFALAVHTGRDWEYVRSGRFGRGDVAVWTDRATAESVGKNYPVSGGHYSRYFRQGNWQVVEYT